MIQDITDRLEKQIIESLEELELIDKARADRIKSSKEYDDYITSKEWQETRQRIFKKYDYKCAFCGSVKNLHVHHITYENLGVEKDADLVALCAECHKEFHEGKHTLPFSNLKLTAKITKDLAASNYDAERKIGRALSPIIDEAIKKSKAEIKKLKEGWDKEHNESRI